MSTFSGISTSRKEKLVKIYIMLIQSQSFDITPFRPIWATNGTKKATDKIALDYPPIFSSVSSSFSPLTYFGMFASIDNYPSFKEDFRVPSGTRKYYMSNVMMI